MTTDTTERVAPTSYPTLIAFYKALTEERFEEYRRAIKTRLGFDPLIEPRRRIGLAEATRLAGVLPGTGTQWRRRTALGQLPKPFPDPVPESPTNKPLYEPFMVAAWLEWAGKWPPESAARPEARTRMPNG